ncbi:hypothetical protein SeMB42_g03877 [Synchytrium endobioticum]|uniref:SUN-like protein 1 n=1 Tax=Synchytrium endobioticum TaxID=286115 RepID=A0A507D315_9FUNG|nr:hypothetical protein SeMB42_g03877 [Synchytrium endobioticum]
MQQCPPDQEHDDILTATEENVSASIGSIFPVTTNSPICPSSPFNGTGARNIIIPTRIPSFEEWSKLKQQQKNNVDPNYMLPKVPDIPEPMAESRKPTNTATEPSKFTVHPIPSLQIVGSSPTPSSKQKASKPHDKERFNFASFNCAAKILQSNPEAKSATSILMESKDGYMLNKCSATDKFVVVELCQDILVDTIVLANLEFFSSMFKDIRVHVADRYPPKGPDGWKLVGTFTAKNIRNFQSFRIKNPLIWARFLKIDFDTYYGNEFYCTLNVLRVYGTTMMEDVREDEFPVYQPTAAPIQASTATIGLRKQFSHAFVPAMSTPISTMAPFSVLFQDHFRDSEPPVNTAEGQPDTYSWREPAGSAYQSPTGTQESIFKTIMKRLSMLEHNATMSFHYLSLQSELINKVFAEHQETQRVRLEATILGMHQEMDDLRQRIDRLVVQQNWMSVLIVLLLLSTKYSQVLQRLLFQRVKPYKGTQETEALSKRPGGVSHDGHDTGTGFDLTEDKHVTHAPVSPSKKHKRKRKQDQSRRNSLANTINDAASSIRLPPFVLN